MHSLKQMYVFQVLKLFFLPAFKPLVRLGVSANICVLHLAAITSDILLVLVISILESLSAGMTPVNDGESPRILRIALSMSLRGGGGGPPPVLCLRYTLALSLAKIDLIYKFISDMPKYQTRCKGIRSATWNHPWQMKWTFEYLKPGGDRQKIQFLDKSDVETLGNRDQIRICKGRVVIRMSEGYDGVYVNVHLPPGVQQLAVKQYGNADPICVAEDYGETVHS